MYSIKTDGTKEYYEGALDVLYVIKNNVPLEPGETNYPDNLSFTQALDIATIVTQDGYKIASQQHLDAIHSYIDKLIDHYELLVGTFE